MAILKIKVTVGSSTGAKVNGVEVKKIEIQKAKFKVMIFC